MSQQSNLYTFHSRFIKSQLNPTNMKKRITVMIDDDNHKKLRNLQSKMIAKSEGTVSFSKVINETIKKGL